MKNDKTKSYWAFISYSSKDRQVGQWLHRRLETYPIPPEFRGQELFDGAVLGKNLRPIFRDRDELACSANLGEAILAALAASRFLVVLCSRNAAQSQWVSKEIEDFQAMGKGNRVLALILDGEPNASARGHEQDECLPPALRYPVEPIAGDLRKEGDGRARGFLKILAGIAQLDFDQLYRRHERAQARKRLVAAIVAATLIAVISSLACFAWQKRQEAVANADRFRLSLAQSHLNRASAALKAGDTSYALAHLARSLRINAKGNPARQALLFLLTFHNWPLPVASSDWVDSYQHESNVSEWWFLSPYCSCYYAKGGTLISLSEKPRDNTSGDAHGPMRVFDIAQRQIIKMPAAALGRPSKEERGPVSPCGLLSASINGRIWQVHAVLSPNESGEFIGKSCNWTLPMQTQHRLMGCIFSPQPGYAATFEYVPTSYGNNHFNFDIRCRHWDIRPGAAIVESFLPNETEDQNRNTEMRAVMPDGQLRHISWNSGGYEIRDSTGALIRKIKTNAYTFNVNFAKPVGRIIPLNSYDGVYLLDGVTGENVLSKHEYIPHFMKAEGHHWLEAYLLPNASYLLLANGNSQSSSGVTYRIWDIKREEAVGDADGGIRLEDDKGFPWLASSDNQWFMYQQEKGTENMGFLTLVDLPTTGREFTATVPLFSHGQSIAGTPVAKWLFEWSGDLPTDILDLAEAIAGCRVTEDGSYQWIDHPEECIGRLRIGLREIRDKDLRCWAEWFLADRATRNIDPFRDLSVTSWSTTQLNRSYTNSCDRDNENDITAFLHFILQHGSSREAQALSGETAAWLAANNGHDKMLALFWKQPVFDWTAIRTEVAAGKRSRIELIHALCCAAAQAARQSKQHHAEARNLYQKALVAASNTTLDVGRWKMLIFSQLSELSFGDKNYPAAAEWSARLVSHIKRQLPDRSAYRQFLAEDALPRLTWCTLLAGRFADALSDGEQAVSLLDHGKACSARLKLAHAYLLTNQFEKARPIYEKYAGKDFEDDRNWNDELRNDFELLRKAGHDHPDMKKIEAMLQEKSKESSPSVIIPRPRNWRNSGLKSEN